MMENREYLNKLFDIYKDLLTEVEQVTFASYYIEDLSLSEIGENRGISKSSVGKTLSNVEEKLKYYENILKLLSTKERLIQALNIDDIEALKKEIRTIIS